VTGVPDLIVVLPKLRVRGEVAHESAMISLSIPFDNARLSPNQDDFRILK
jgi:hypothetical protein